MTLRWKFSPRTLFEYASTSDAKNATDVIGAVRQGGLGLPDRDYYVSDRAKMKEIREAYRAYVAQMFGLLGDTPSVAAKKADQVMDLETRLARAALDRVVSRDPIKTSFGCAAGAPMVRQTRCEVW